jgi:hypothetical protein
MGVSVFSGQGNGVERLAAAAAAAREPSCVTPGEG